MSDSDSPPTKLGLTENVRWKIDCPSGASSPVVWGDKIFLTAYDEDKLWTLCYAKADGKLLWKVQAPATKIEKFHATEGSPAASTPVTDGNNVVVYFGSCGLVCYNFDGEELWRREMPCVETNFGFGTGVSPILYSNKVVLQRDTSGESFVATYLISSGKELWRKDRTGFGTSFGSPMVWGDPGEEVVVPGAMRMKGYDLNTGAEKWTIRNLPAAACTTPVNAGGMIFFAGWSPGGEDFPIPSLAEILASAKKLGHENGDGALSRDEKEGTMLQDFFDNNDTNADGKITADEWDGVVAAMRKGRNLAMAIKPGATGDATETHVAWTFTKGLPYVPSPVIHNSKLWLIRDGGLLTCLNTADGQPLLQQHRVGAEGSYYASPVIAGGHLYLCSLPGVLTVLKPGEPGSETKAPERTARVDFGERIFATPAIADHTLYVRTASKLYAFRETGK